MHTQLPNPLSHLLPPGHFSAPPAASRTPQNSAELALYPFAPLMSCRGGCCAEVHRGQHFDTGCDVYAMALVVWELLTLKRPFHEFQEHMLPGLVGWGAQVLRGLAGARRRIFFVFCARAQQSRAPAAASQQLRPPGAAGCFGLQPGRWCAAGQSTLPARPASASDRKPVAAAWYVRAAGGGRGQEGCCRGGCAADAGARCGGESEHGFRVCVCGGPVVPAYMHTLGVRWL